MRLDMEAFRGRVVEFGDNFGAAGGDEIHRGGRCCW